MIIFIKKNYDAMVYQWCDWRNMGIEKLSIWGIFAAYNAKYAAEILNDQAQTSNETMLYIILVLMCINIFMLIFHGMTVYW